MPLDLAYLVRPTHTALVLQEVQNGVVGPTSALPALAEAASDFEPALSLAPAPALGQHNREVLGEI